MVLIHDRILKIDIYNFEMSQITPEKSLKSNQIYSVVGAFSVITNLRMELFEALQATTSCGKQKEVVRGDWRW